MTQKHLDIFEAIASGNHHRICRTANMIDTGEAYVAAMVGLHAAGLQDKAYVILEDGIVLHTLTTLLEVYDYELGPVVSVIDSDYCFPAAGNTARVLEWFAAQYARSKETKL